ncbi:glycosyltransferase [Halorhodospira sp. 9628]|uniref:glycosyltransferase n=1 Tax=Halorhodospira sp. 9628 TaxID=2899137 RepID=UPI001EE998C3|nr:glycosyltransferase [Halorhodospira halophila]MCG5542128.1 glycosyltransferase [Halorhodospira sp. 9628]
MVLAGSGPWWIGKWIKFWKPKRVILICQLPNIRQTLKRINELEKVYGLERYLEIVYAARWIRDAVGRPGRVLISPIDIERFRPCAASLQRNKDDFTVGRMSRDIYYKHHPDDKKLYSLLAELGIKVRIMGGECLGLEKHPNIEVIREGEEAPEEFLKSLDVFFYRTDTRFWVEPHGRVVTEALASGLPVVCGNQGGFTEWVVPDQNGYITSGNPEVVDAIKKLRTESSAYKRLAKGARTTAEDAFSIARIDEMVWYLARGKV